MLRVLLSKRPINVIIVCCCVDYIGCVSNPCVNGGTCLKSVDSYYKCSCTSSYQDIHCEGKCRVTHYYFLVFVNIKSNNIQRFRD